MVLIQRENDFQGFSKLHFLEFEKEWKVSCDPANTSVERYIRRYFSFILK